MRKTQYVDIARDVLGDMKDYIKTLSDVQSIVHDSAACDPDIDADLLYEAALHLLNTHAVLYTSNVKADHCKVCQKIYEHDGIGSIKSHLITRHTSEVLARMFN